MAVVLGPVVGFTTAEPPPVVPYLYTTRREGRYHHLLTTASMKPHDVGLWESPEGLLYALQRGGGSSEAWFTVLPTRLFLTPHGALRMQQAAGSCASFDDVQRALEGWHMDAYLNVYDASTGVAVGRPHRTLWARPHERVLVNRTKAITAVRDLACRHDFDVVWDGEALWRVGRRHQWRIGRAVRL